MPQFRKKPIVIEAAQWRKLGDHPQVEMYPHGGGTCKECGQWLREHGQVKTLEGWHIVCPGDWIIRGVAGEFYPCKPAIFASTYAPADFEAQGAWQAAYGEEAVSPS